ncbi:MAG: polyprenyl synthetase family protein [Dehalococcoidia bacterium]
MLEPAFFHPYRQAVNRELQDFLSGRPLPLYDMMTYHLGWRDESGAPGEAVGKKLRPIFCLLACRAVGGDPDTSLPAASALEMLHNFSLVHDDIEDETGLRRHRPAVWKLWGPAQGINVGDAMMALAHMALYELEARGTDPARVLQAARILDETCLELCEGQYLDISFDSRQDVGVDDYVIMVSKKTGALFEASFKMGALLGSDTDSLMGPLGEFGRKMGLVFQIRDDFLGIWGEETVTGKPWAADIRRKKKTLPIIYALHQAKGAAGRDLEELYGQESLGDRDVSRVMGILDDLGARDYVQDMAAKRHEEALSALETTGLAPSAQEELREVGAYLMEREY